MLRNKHMAQQQRLAAPWLPPALYCADQNGMPSSYHERRMRWHLQCVQEHGRVGLPCGSPIVLLSRSLLFVANNTYSSSIDELYCLHVFIDLLVAAAHNAAFKMTH